MVTFDYIKYKNLLSTGNYWITINLNENTNTLFIGENGAGKSTFLDALCFALFGRPFRDIKIGSLINTINQKDMLVEVGFTTNGKKYVVERGLKPKVFKIHQDGILINQESTVKDYQDILEKSILHFNFKSFTQIVILGSASFTPFMQLSTPDRRLIIEDILDIQIFSVMNLIAKDKLSNLKELIQLKKEKIELIKQRYDIEKKHFDDMKRDNSSRIEELNREIEISKERMLKLDNDYSELLSLSKDLTDFISSNADVRDRIKKLVKIENTVSNRIRVLNSDVKFLYDNDICPKCRQHIDEDFRINELSNINSEAEELKTGLDNLKVNLDNENDILKTVVIKEDCLNKINIKMASISSSKKELERYINKVSGMVSKVMESSNMSVLSEDSLIGIMDELNILNNELRSLLTEKEYYDTAIGLLKDSGVKTKIIKQYLPMINKLVNMYMTEFDFFVNFNFDESFKETIKSRHRDVFSYSNFSEGEKTRINLAIMLTWREIAKIKNSAHTNLLILDEVFESSLDYGGVDNLLNILHSMEDVNIHVISHKMDYMQDKFDRVVRFYKSKNFSKMRVL